MAYYNDFVGGETTELTTRLNDNILAALNGIGGNLLESGQTYSRADAPYDRRRDTGASGLIPGGFMMPV